MKLNFRDFIRKAQFPILLAAGSLPLPMLICAESIPESVGACLILAGLYVLLAWITIVLPGKIRIPVGLLFSAAMVAACISLLPLNGFVAAWLIPVLYAALIMGGLRIGGMSRGQELHPLCGALCLAAHLILQMLVNADKVNGGELEYAPVAGVLTLSFILFGAMAMLELNRISLNNAVNGLSSVPTSMRRKNNLLNLATMAVTLLIAGLPAVIRAIEKAWEYIATAIILLIQFLLSLFPSGEGGGGGGGGGLPDLGGEYVEPNRIAKMLEKVLIVAAMLLAVVLLFFALRVLWRKFKVLMKILWERLNKYMAASSEDYVDEVSATREDGVVERLLRWNRKRAQRVKVDESTLSPQERVRYRYQLAWMKHPEWTSDRTARENLPEDAAQIYERARYSDHEITARDADNFAQKSDTKKR